MNYRFKDSYNIITFPTDPTEEDRGLKECCEPQLKLASLIDNASEKNDLTGVVIKASDISDTVTFSIKRCDDQIDLPLLGNVLVCPQDNLAFGFIFEWKQYLIAHGRGKYQISINYTISGVVGGYIYGTYFLDEFSISRASGTVRIYSKFDSKDQLKNIDYTSSNFEDTIRFKGYFGDIQPKTVINNLINKGRKEEKVTREDLTEYTLRTNLLSSLLTEQIRRNLRNQDECWIMDHNISNHIYFNEQVPVVIASPPEYEYFDGGRPAKMTVVFGDRIKNVKSYYNLQ